MDGTSAIDGRFPGENPLRTVLYLMYHHPSSPKLAALAQDLSARMKLKILERNIEDDIRDKWLTQALARFPHVFFYPTGSPLHPSTESSSTSSSQLYIKKNSRAAPITYKVTNRSAKRLPPHLNTPPVILQYLHHSTISRSP